MRILLTGATGFVGSHAARSLSEAGHSLRLLTRSTSILDGVEGLDYERVVADLRDGEGLASACAEIDTIVHVAGVTSARRERTFYEVNGQGTASLGKAAVEAGVHRFLYVSSLAAMGPSAFPEDPEAPPHPVTAYGSSKLAGEREIVALAGDMEVQILRPPAVYGPRDTGLLPFFQMSRRRFVMQFGRGRNRVAMVYGPDLGESIQRLVESESGGSAYFHIADPAGPYTWSELLRTLNKGFGHRTLRIPVPPLAFSVLARWSVATSGLIRRDPLLDRSRYTEMSQPAWVCDSAALEAHLGWAPRTLLADGIGETIAWYREHRWI